MIQVSILNNTLYYEFIKFISNDEHINKNYFTAEQIKTKVEKFLKLRIFI